MNKKQNGCSREMGQDELEFIDTATLIQIAEERFGSNWAEVVRNYSKF